MCHGVRRMRHKDGSSCVGNARRRARSEGSRGHGRGYDFARFNFVAPRPTNNGGEGTGFTKMGAIRFGRTVILSESRR